jgi:cell wall-associated NlpC family hydrolase
MFLTESLSSRIVTVSSTYLGRGFNFEEFNCVHFVRKVYFEVGIVFPLLIKNQLPPTDFHLSQEEFDRMPIGHSIFFKRKDSKSDRLWSHVAIIWGKDKLIHCTRNLGSGVVITSTSEFLKVYALSPKS